MGFKRVYISQTCFPDELAGLSVATLIWPIHILINMFSALKGSVLILIYLVEKILD